MWIRILLDFGDYLKYVLRAMEISIMSTFVSELITEAIRLIANVILTSETGIAPSDLKNLYYILQFLRSVLSIFGLQSANQVI